MELNKHEGGLKYISVLKDGKFHQTVPTGTEGAIVRKYTDRDEVEQEKTELVFDEAIGLISKISVEDSNFGKVVQIEMDGEGIVSLNADSSFGKDIMKKLPNIDLKETVALRPYAFEDDKGKNRRGISIIQKGEKVQNYYWDKENSTPINGIPVPEEGLDWKSEDAKIFFLTEKKFLIEETEKLAIDF